MCVWVCVVIPFILDVGFVDVPAGVTQEEGHTGFLHLPSAVLALIFSRKGSSRSFPSSIVKTNFVYLRFRIVVLHLMGIFYLFIYIFM